MQQFISRRRTHPKSRPVAMLLYDNIEDTSPFTVYNTINLSTNDDFARFEHVLFCRGLQSNVMLLIQDFDKILPAIQKKVHDVLQKLTGTIGNKKTKLQPPKPSNPLLLHATTRQRMLPSIKTLGIPMDERSTPSDIQAFWMQSGVDYSELSRLPQDYQNIILELSPSLPSHMCLRSYMDRHLAATLTTHRLNIVDCSASLFLDWDMPKVDQRYVRSKLTLPFRV